MSTTTRLSPLLATLLALLVTASALAADIPRLERPVTDRTGVLTASTGQIEAALNDLLDDHDIQLFVVFVNSTEELTVTGFADEMARVNSLGVNDALLLVALNDRTDAIWVSNGLPQITDAEIDTIVSGVLEPGLRSGDYPAAVVATVRALGDAASATAPPGGPTPAPTVPTDGSTSGGVNLGTVLGLLIVVSGGVLVWRWLKARQDLLREAGERDRRTAQLAREANARLIATDERIRSADEEAGFVEAEYGGSEAEPFRVAITEARAELRAAFSVRQKLDDGEPEDPPTREAMLKEILDRLGRAGATLDRQSARIQQLRDLERDAPEIVKSLPDQIAAQEARLPAAEAALERLMWYAESAWGSIQGNVEEARKGLTGARAAVERAAADMAKASREPVGRGIRLAQEGIAGSAALMDAVERLAATTVELERRLNDQLAAAERDVSAARAALGAAAALPGAPDRSGQLDQAEAALRAGRAAAEARPLDPIAAHHMATEAQTLSTDILATLRNDAAQQAQLAAAVDAALIAARDAVSRAADFITTRHLGVGREARTRLAEAERLLQGALAVRSTDPKAAHDQAGRAHALAGQAYALAGSDFERWNHGGPSAAGGSDMAGAILGSIIGSILSSGGGRGGGWGGSTWGSTRSTGGSSSGGGGGWGGGRSRGSSFGGFGGGGGGGGGGGRSRGGRW